MNALSGKLKQTLTYWAYAGPDSAGDPTFSSPVAISGRWDYDERLILDSRGKERHTTSVIYVGQDITTQGFLYLGTSVVADPRTLNDAYEIFAYNKTPSVDGNDFVREVLC